MTWEDRAQMQLVRKRGLGTECPGGAEAGSLFRTEGGWEPQGRTLLRTWLWS